MSEAKGRFLLISRNLVCIMAAERVINDVQGIVSCFRRDYPQSNDADCFSVGLTFPYVKTTGRCSIERAMLENIDSFSEQKRTDKYIIENNIALDGSVVIG